MSKAKELAEQMFPEPQMENYDDILEYRNDRDWTFIARGAFVKGYEQAKEEMMKDAIDTRIDKRLADIIGYTGSERVKVIIIKE